MPPHWRELQGRVINEGIEQWVEQLVRARRWKPVLYIGTDSQVWGRDIKFATVVVVHWPGEGARLGVRTQWLKRTRMTMAERLLHEIWLSIAAFEELQPVVRRHRIGVEIHADINPNPMAGSYRVYRQAIGYLKGLGIPFKMKPEAVASTSCANWFVQR